MNSTETIPLSEVVVGTRIRVELGDIESFAESIRDVGGLIHPIAIDYNKNLIAGGRRFTAYSFLHKKYPEEPWGEIPYTVTDTANSKTTLRMLELEENIRRKEMTWKERISSIAEIHTLHQREAHSKGEKWALRHTEELLNVDHSVIGVALKLAEALSDPKHPIQNCDSAHDAFRLLLQHKEDEASRRLAMLTIPAQPLVREQSKDVLELLASLPQLEPLTPASSPIPDPTYEAKQCIACSGTGKNSKGDMCPICHGAAGASFEGESVTIPLSQMFIMRESLGFLNSLPKDSIDHICTDPPYGIDMDNLEQENTGMSGIATVRDTHEVMENLDLLENFIPNAFRVLKPGGFCILWCDYMHFRMLVDIGMNTGFKVQRWPNLWVKTGPAINQAAAYNFTKDHECAVVMRKGGTLVSPQSTSYMVCGPADKNKFRHPFAKPVELWKWLLRGIAIPGQTILDPFAGSGSSCYAAAELGLRPFGIEISEVHFCNLINVMREGYQTWMSPKKVLFT